MNLVRPAMRRPLTIVVAVIAVALGSVLALRQMPRDIFPTLGIPTIYVAQPFGGMDPAQMEGYHLLLRVSLPLHHRNRARGIEVDSGRGHHQTAILSRHRYVAGDVR